MTATGVEVVATFGPARRRVRVVRKPTATGTRVVCQWYEKGQRHEKSWPDTRANLRAAKEWAEEFARRRILPTPVTAPRLTVRELWKHYQADQFRALRPRTRLLYSDSWRKWELFAGAHFVAEDVTGAMLHSFRRELERQGLGVNSLKHIVQNLKTIHAWAEREELIGRNRWRLYKLKIGKDQQPESPDEYTADEFRRIIAEFDPAKATQWRPWVALTILGAQGVRQVAGLQLKWTDLDLPTRQILWPAATDKNGKAWRQPLRQATVRALRIARDWARAQGVESEYVIYSGSRLNTRGAYSGQSLWDALRKAETRAGITHRPYRAAHGFRRMVSGDVFDVTGNALLALRAIGDRDARMANRYLKQRDKVVSAAFRAADRRTP